MILKLRTLHAHPRTPRNQRGVVVLFLIFIVSVVGLLLAFNMNLMGCKQANLSINEYHNKISFANAQSGQELVRHHVEQRLGTYFADDSVFAMTYTQTDPATGNLYAVEVRDDPDPDNKVLEFTVTGYDTYDLATEVDGQTRVTTTVSGKISLDQGGKFYDWSESQTTTTVSD